MKKTYTFTTILSFDANTYVGGAAGIGAGSA